MSVTVKNIASHPLLLNVAEKTIPLLPQQSVQLPESALVVLAPWIKGGKVQVVKSNYQVEVDASAPVLSSPSNVETLAEYSSREIKDSPGEDMPPPAKPKRTRKKKPTEE